MECLGFVQCVKVAPLQRVHYLDGSSFGNRSPRVNET